MRIVLLIDPGHGMTHKRLAYLDRESRPSAQSERDVVDEQLTADLKITGDQPSHDGVDRALKSGQQWLRVRLVRDQREQRRFVHDDTAEQGRPPRRQSEDDRAAEGVIQRSSADTAVESARRVSSPLNTPAGVELSACFTGLAPTFAWLDWGVAGGGRATGPSPRREDERHTGGRIRGFADDTNWCSIAEDTFRKGSLRRMGNDMPPPAGRPQTMPALAPARSQQSYRHEAFLWRDAAEFADGLVPFIEDGLAAGEPVMVALVRDHAEWLRDRLAAGEASRVQFVDMAKLGRNPAQIIPAWQGFLARHSGYRRPARGIGEPIWVGRRSEEMLECQLHEALLNVAVDPEIPFWLVCPYDVERLDDSVVAEAYRSHPTIVGNDSYAGSPTYGGRAHADSMFHAELPPMPGQPAELVFTMEHISDVISFVTVKAAVAGLWSDKIVNLATAIRQLAADGLTRGGTSGIIRVWDDAQASTFEIHTPTPVDDLLAGRHPPRHDHHDPLSRANRICDLVQMRSTRSGTTVRLHTWK